MRLIVERSLPVTSYKKSKPNQYYTCPVHGCSANVKRLGPHLRTHTELPKSEIQRLACIKIPSVFHVDLSPSSMCKKARSSYMTGTANSVNVDQGIQGSKHLPLSPGLNKMQHQHDYNTNDLDEEPSSYAVHHQATCTEPRSFATPVTTPPRQHLPLSSGLHKMQRQLDYNTNDLDEEPFSYAVHHQATCTEPRSFATSETTPPRLHFPSITGLNNLQLQPQFADHTNEQDKEPSHAVHHETTCTQPTRSFATPTSVPRLSGLHTIVNGTIKPLLMSSINQCS